MIPIAITAEAYAATETTMPLRSLAVEPPLGSGWQPWATLSKCSGTMSRRASWSRWPCSLGRMVRVNERGIFEEARWIAVRIRCCEREGRRRDC